ncbi:MAG: NDP-sugar synthase [bacterium]|nr:NDP-sugar synthase [bacterium]
MKAIIIAGGKGERLRPLTDTLPKPMVEIDGKPLLFHTLDLLKSHGVKDFVIALCYLPEKIVSYFGDGSKFGVHIEYTYENPENPLGTAGAITLDKTSTKENFIVTYADILRKLDITDMINHHKKTKSFATLNVYKREGRDPKSMVEFDGNKKILKFTERPAAEDIKNDYVWANGSFYILEPEIFNFVPESVKSDFGADIFPKLLAEKKDLYAYPTTDYFIDIGNLEKLEQARKTFHKSQ